MLQTLTKNSLLIFTNILVFSATIYSLLENQVGNRDAKAFIFPNKIPLTSWNQIESDLAQREALRERSSLVTREGELVKPPITLESGTTITPVKHYHYVKDDLTINVSVSYVVNTRGNVYQLIDTQTGIPNNVLNQQQIKKHNDIGFYSVFQDNDYAYLSSCLDSQGKATVTSQQFSANLNQVKLTPSLLAKWLLGKASIRDRRCVWLHLSIPLQSEVKTSHKILENTWIDLVKWWSPNFPEL